MRLLGWLVLLATVGGALLAGCDPKYHYEPGHLEWELRDEGTAMGLVRDALRTWRDEHGRYPTNDEGLLALGDAVEELTATSDFPYEFEYLWIRDNPVRSRSGVLSLWGVPYLYENGTGLDPDPRWGVRVDEGVWIWSVGARQVAGRLDALRREMLLGRFGGALAIFAASLFLGWTRRRGRPGWTGWKFGAALAFLVAGLFGQATMVTCYVMRRFSLWKRPALAAEYEAILGKYRDAGVLTEKTWHDLVTALHEENELLKREGE